MKQKLWHDIHLQHAINHSTVQTKDRALTLAENREIRYDAKTE